MSLEWDAGAGVLRFETELLAGNLRADGKHQAVTDLTYRPANLRVNSDRALAPYRLLCRSGWLGEAREMAHTAVPTEDGVEVTWLPSLGHQALLVCRYIIREPGIIDCIVTVFGQASYVDYEVFFSGYFAPSFRSGAYMAAAQQEAIQVRPEANPLFRDMYVAFPRDERAAAIITDGRWQRGRHFTRFLPARYYGLPLGFFGQRDGPVDALMMGLPRDVFAVSAAYATDDPTDSVGQHNSLYLSLFGRDLHPGDGWRTALRLQVGSFEHDAGRHREVFAAFRAAYDTLPGSCSIDDTQPGSVLRGLPRERR